MPEQNFMTAPPSSWILTVILIIGDKRERAQRALQSILAQDIADRILVLVYDRSSTPAQDFPELTRSNVVYEPSGPNTTLGELQKRAVQTATTDIIGLLEEHVVVPAGWARKHLRLHEEGYAAVTGRFLSGNPRHYCSRVAFAVTYGDYILSKEIGETTSIPGDNSTFIRAKILRYYDELEMLFNTDILLIRRLLANGEKLYRSECILHHWNETSWLSAWIALCYWNQMYCRNQSIVENWSLGRRLLRLCTVPLVPFVRTYGNFRRAKMNGVPVTRFIADAPAVFFLNSGSAAGIAAALLFGYQDSEYKFADCETCAVRVD
jgi:hypothetical protein